MTGADQPLSFRCPLHRERFKAAARGDADAQRALACDYYSDFVAAPDLLGKIPALQNSITWARAVEANTRSAGDGAFLAQILAAGADLSEAMGDAAAASSFMAEVVGLLDRVASLDAGEDAGLALLSLAAISTPAELAEAKAEREYYDA